MYDKRFSGDGLVYGENNHQVSPLSDDYEHYKSAQENLTNPLSDDYNKYANE